MYAEIIEYADGFSSAIIDERVGRVWTDDTRRSRADSIFAAFSHLPFGPVPFFDRVDPTRP